jgi:hypothetical protein
MTPSEENQEDGLFGAIAGADRVLDICFPSCADKAAAIQRSDHAQQQSHSRSSVSPGPCFFRQFTATER